MKPTTKSHRGLTTLTASIGALLLALASVHVASAQTNTGTGPNVNVVTTNGTSAARSITTGANNTAFGFSALQFDTTGGFNTALGSLALNTNIIGSQNTAVGYGALTTNKTSGNTAFGYNVLNKATTGPHNTAIGHSALFRNTTGGYNTAVGREALSFNTIGTNNTALGYQALLNNTAGDFNVAIGDGALLNNTGNGNIAIGEDAGFALTTGSNNIDIGNAGVPGESGIIRIGTSPTHTATFLTGIIHGNGSGLTGLIVPAASVTGTITAAQITNLAVTNAKIATAAVTSTKLASGLTLGGTTTGTFSGNLTGNATNVSGIVAIANGGTGSSVLNFVRLTTNQTIAGTKSFTGRVGIGTTSPQTALHVVGTITADGFVATATEPPANVIPVLGMAWIKPGTFIMGSRPDEPGRKASGPGNEGPQTVVTLTKGFWMGVHEVTQSEYLNVMGSNPSSFTGNVNRPVETVSWSNAVAYCTALTTTERTAGRLPTGWGYRLPTEAEWEYACRAGARTSRFGYGDDLGAVALGNYAWYSSKTSGTNPVEQKQANPWGLMDMHGNVYEWCQDRIGTYPGGSVTDPQGPGSGTDRSCRGGGWDEVATTCRSAQRGFSPGGAVNNIGFRVVLSSGVP